MTFCILLVSLNTVHLRLIQKASKTGSHSLCKGKNGRLCLDSRASLGFHFAMNTKVDTAP